MENLQFLFPFVKTYGYWIIGLGILLECMGIPFPGETLLIVGGILAAQGGMNIVAVILVAAAASILGDNIGYWIGKKFGKSFLYPELEKYRFIKPQHVKKVEAVFLKYGSATIIIGRFTAILRTYTALLAGVFEVPYPVFLGLNLAGGIVWAGLIGLIAYKMAGNLSLLGGIVDHIRGLALLALAVLIFWFVWKWFKKRGKIS